MTFEQRLKMIGEVRCFCGGVVISETGRVKLHGMSGLWISCNKCGRMFDADKAFAARQENKTIVLGEEHERLAKKTQSVYTDSTVQI